MPRTMQKKNPILAKKIGHTIAKYRQAKGLTQDQVAERLNIGLEAVSRLERGIVMPTVERLVELAEIFGCRAADLLMESSDRTEDQSAQMQSLLAEVGVKDRDLILGIVEKLAKRFKNIEL